MDRSEVDKQALEDAELSSNSNSSSSGSSLDLLNVELKQCGPKEWSDFELYNFQPSNVSLIFSRDAPEGQNWILFFIYSRIRYAQLREIARGSPQLFDLGDVNEIYGDLKVTAEPPKQVEHIPLSDVVQNLIDGRGAAVNQNSNSKGATLEVENNGTATLHVPANTWSNANTGPPNLSNVSSSTGPKFGGVSSTAGSNRPDLGSGSSSAGSKRPDFGSGSSSAGSKRPDFGSGSSSAGSQPINNIPSSTGTQPPSFDFPSTNPFASIVNPSSGGTSNTSASQFSAGRGGGTSNATSQPIFSAGSGTPSGTTLNSPGGAGSRSKSTSSTGYKQPLRTPSPKFGTGPSTSTPVRKSSNVPDLSSKVSNASGSVSTYTYKVPQPQTSTQSQQPLFDLTKASATPLPTSSSSSSRPPPPPPPLGNRGDQSTGAAGPSKDALAGAVAQTVVNSDLTQPGLSGLVGFGETPPPPPTKVPVGFTRDDGGKVAGLVTSSSATQDTASGPFGFNMSSSLLDIDYDDIEEVVLLPTIATPNP